MISKQFPVSLLALSPTEKNMGLRPISPFRPEIARFLSPFSVKTSADSFGALLDSFGNTIQYQHVVRNSSERRIPPGSTPGTPCGRRNRTFSTFSLFLATEYVTSQCYPSISPDSLWKIVWRNNHDRGIFAPRHRPEIFQLFDPLAGEGK
jgi:hypothetical protein